MRLFVAVDLPLSMMDALAESSALLREQVKGRYCSPDSFHVTLAFLGEQPASCVEELAGIVEHCAASHSPIKACLGELGSFGKKRDATLWQGFQDPKPLENLARDLRRMLDEAGFNFDNKTPKAHITLMRRADLSSGTLPCPAFAKGCIETITLYQSELTPQGAIYTALHKANLSAYGVS